MTDPTVEPIVEDVTPPLDELHDEPHETRHDTMQAIRDAIVDSALIHVAFDGWSGRTLRAAAVDAGFEPGQAERAFPGGAAEAVAHWCNLADRRMEQALREADTEGLRLHERIGMAIRLRLEPLEMDREAVRRGIAVLSLPMNSRLSLRCTYRTVDTIWWAVGDASTDFNFYSKRMQLAGIYMATLLYWLDDSSDGSTETWAFLERRLDTMVRLRKARTRVEAGLSRIPNPISAAWKMGDRMRDMAERSPFGARRRGA
ncbi:COQ9 family protein [Rhodospira trueperi]|uniref:Ubiquinone biosynthesis protein COQ9 n=1 Tax=Rhodospira trueperi TaxID=69960 RepID=A0A1G6WN27_9PROT|nr:COQ9 family protein [Rhodospira trueperi]SDD67204.1 ubiquinone biosynthesis protein COQ9 [Rhodospira trueperi]